jgi:DNA-binding response OmpR family regulator
MGNAMDASTGRTATAILVEHDAKVRGYLADYLTTARIAVHRYERGDAALAEVQAHAPDFVLVDALAPGINGLDFCRRLRESDRTMAVVILAETLDPLDEIVGLEIGADDYVARDIPGRLLLARMKAIQRRLVLGSGTPRSSEDWIRMGRFVIDRRSREIRSGDRALELSPREFNCVWLLASRAGTPLTRDEIRQDLCVKGRSVDSQISRIRRKLDRFDPAINRIKSVRSTGYMFSPPAH